MVTRSGTGLAALFDASGLTDHQLAQTLGIHPSLISKYRSGARRPSKRHAELLSQYFGLEQLENDTIQASDLVDNDWID